jgi:hypothetical protein
VKQRGDFLSLKHGEGKCLLGSERLRESMRRRSKAPAIISQIIMLVGTILSSHTGDPREAKARVENWFPKFSAASRDFCLIRSMRSFKAVLSFSAKSCGRLNARNQTLTSKVADLEGTDVDDSGIDIPNNGWFKRIN